ncbi:transcriptional regulator [Blastococcus xanthinilyticus]|uniref:Winged helix DNA-binding protein n=1 Tax=Blastococcus xanthinilyticus TaxID=1564164 RepID=A0A5S5D3E9_9ACTN|nr:transcriptional regulator [Blastococcus xanthinilyticus]TYP89149.1 winged helix DNA-binding protein [Blastococcus xanthinilyticus]
MTAEAPAFDEVIHAPQRLRICAMLSAAQKVEFAVLQDELALSKSALSKHLSQLVDSGYVTQERSVRDARSRLWLSLTAEGRRAYRGHVRALQEIVAAEIG